jgi:single-strand DNA-binding protein
MLNHVTLIGRATREPDLKFTADGVAVAQFTLAVDRPYASKQGQREADFIPVVVWRKTAEVVGNWLSKGRLVAVEGELRFESYEKDGQRRTAAKVVAHRVQFLERRREEAAQPGASAAQADLPPELAADDLPF